MCFFAQSGVQVGMQKLGAAPGGVETNAAFGGQLFCKFGKHGAGAGRRNFLGITAQEWIRHIGLILGVVGFGGIRCLAGFAFNQLVQPEQQAGALAGAGNDPAEVARRHAKRLRTPNQIQRLGSRSRFAGTFHLPIGARVSCSVNTN